MRKEYEVLFTPAKIGTCEIKNRFVMCPMAGTAVINWVHGKAYDPEIREFFINRAKDGIGLMIPGAFMLRSVTTGKWLYKNPKAFKGVRELMDEIHSYGSKVFFQMSAGTGRNFTYTKEMQKRYGLMNLLVKLDYLGASADAGLPNRWIPEIKTKQMAKKEIDQLIKAMAETAYLCKINGVDGVDVHAVHEGYLLDQFSLAYTNHRTDEYGGSLENRLRFACEIVKAIKDRCGRDYPVTLRYSVTSRTRDFGKGIIPADHESVEIGRTIDESKEAIRILSEAGYDAFNADNGTYDAWYYAHPPVYMPLNCNLEQTVAVRPDSDKPFICAGRMQLKEAAEAIKDGKLDFIGIGRQFLADENYLTKIREERDEDVLPCIACHIGCMPIGLHKDSGCIMPKETGVCALNPYTRQEAKYAMEKTSNPKRFAVIGGGIAGIEFALQADKRGHKVDLYEKTDRLCGVFNQAAAFTFKEKDRDLITYYETALKKSKVNVHMNTYIENLSDIEADEYIIATGASATRTLKVEGGENSISAVDFIAEGLSCEKEAVVIGGGLTGCEIAYELAMAGKKVAIVEMQDDILKIEGASMANTSYLRDAFEYYKVPIYTSAQTIRIKKDGVVIKTEDGQTRNLSADRIVTSIGYVNGHTFNIEGMNNVHIIGDADNVSNLKNAIWQANDLVIRFK